MKRLQAHDFFTLTSREMTPEGYLRAPASLARTGVQTYRAYELGLDAQGMDPMRMVRLYRPPEEVFSPDSMASFENKPVTIDHPPSGVTADNWKEHAVGDAHGISRAGDLMTGELVIRDANAIKTVQEEGKAQLSNGYTFDLDLTPGKTASGEAYDGIQRNIRGNHVAIVDAARCGSACRIADHNPEGERKMATRKVVIDGIPVEVDDTAAAAIEKITKERDTLKASLGDVEAKLKAVKVGDKTMSLDDLVKLASDQAAEIEKLKKDVMTPEARDAMVADWAKTLTEAKRLIPDIKTDGKTCLAIRREVVKGIGDKHPTAKAVADAVLGGKTADDADEALMRAAFNAVSAAIPAGDTTTVTTDADRTVADALTGDGKRTTDAPQLSGRDAFLARQANAWQGKAAQ